MIIFFKAPILMTANGHGLAYYGAFEIRLPLLVLDKDTKVENIF